MFPTSDRSLPRTRWLRGWLWGLNAVLIVAALVLAATLSRRALFLLALVPLAFVPFSYARVRQFAALERMLSPGGRGARALPALLVAGGVLDAIMVAQLLTGRASDEAMAFLRGPGIAWIGPVWFSTYAILFLAYAMAGFARGLRSGGRGFARRIGFAPPPTPAAEGPASPERRAFLQRASLAGAAMPLVVSVSSVPLSYDFRVETREVVLPRWPRRLDGLRVVHLSDIHVGGGMTRERLLRMAELTNGCRPDLVLHTGDFLTHRTGDFDLPLYEALARIEAPHGQWASLGNHDFDDPGRLMARMRDAGVTVLRDRLARVEIDGEPIEIAGADFVYDRSRHAEIYARLMASWPARSELPRLLLNHDPSTFAALPENCADLVLAGHTHGGHVGVQLGPDAAITVVGLAGFPDQGFFRRGDMQLFVTRCVGFYGYPMRVGIPPEIALLVLRSPPSDTTPA